MAELYKITLGNQNYYYTSNDSDIIFNNQTYKAVSIYRHELSRDSLFDNAKIVCNFDLEPINLYKDFNPSISVFVTIMNTQEFQLFNGRIVNVEFNLNNGNATIFLSAVGGLLKANIPFRTYSKECDFSLFGTGCEVNKANFSVTLANNFTISQNGLSIISDKLKEYENGFFSGGYVKYLNQHSYISNHTNDTIIIMFPLKNLHENDVIIVYAGCDKLIETCKNKFNNSKNYGGFPFIPSKNPVTQGF